MTLKQILILYEESQLRKLEEYKIIAGLHGVNLDDNIEREKTKTEKNNVSFLAFQDPKKYRNLSKEKREEITEKMLSQHKNWSVNKL